MIDLTFFPLSNILKLATPPPPSTVAAADAAFFPYLADSLALSPSGLSHPRQSLETALAYKLPALVPRLGTRSRPPPVEYGMRPFFCISRSNNLTWT